MADQDNEYLTFSSSQRIIPIELDEILFFMYMNGVSYADIVEKYKESETPFNIKQLRNFAYKQEWPKRKELIEKELKSDFTDIIKQCQAKKISAVAMAVQTVSDMIIRDVTEYRADPTTFWREVNDRLRPRPFWLAKNVEDLTTLFKLQQFLETGNEEGGSSRRGLTDQEHTNLLQALANAAQIPASSVPVPQLESPVVDAEITIEPTVEEISVVTQEDDDDDYI